MRTITADVVVIGAGPAGMAAAAVAVEAGAAVTVVEAGEKIGGNAVHSNGYLAFVGSDVQIDHDIDDSVEAFVADARRAYEAAAERFALEWDEASVRMFATESSTTYRQLVRRGVRFSRLVSRPEHSVDRVLAVENPAMFADAFAADLASARVRTVFGARAQRLVMEGGRVVGVRVQQDDKPIMVRAGRGVVLTSGGYQANPALRAQFQPGSAASTPHLGINTCRGDGHVIGSAVGGDLVNMTFLPPMVIVASPVAESAIAVGVDGRRFHDETASFGARVERLRAQPGRRAWYVLDDTVVRTHAALIAQMPQPPVRATTIDELAGTIGVPAETLATTVVRWNDFLASPAPVDAEFGRRALPPGRRGISASPFAAVAMIEGVNFSCGGFRTTTHMQVLDVLGEPIPGLYAAGDTCAGLNAAAEMSGLHINGAFTLGRIAGRAAACGRRDTDTVSDAAASALRPSATAWWDPAEDRLFATATTRSAPQRHRLRTRPDSAHTTRPCAPGPMQQ